MFITDNEADHIVVVRMKGSDVKDPFAIGRYDNERRARLALRSCREDGKTAAVGLFHQGKLREFSLFRGDYTPQDLADLIGLNIV